MKLRFIGNDKDILTQQLGFVYGNVYNVRFTISNKMIFLSTKTQKGKPIMCPYSSVEAILNNWEVYENVR